MSHTMYVCNIIDQLRNELDKYRNKLNSDINLLHHIHSFLNNYYDLLFYTAECSKAFNEHNLSKTTRIFNKIKSLLTSVNRAIENNESTEELYEDYVDYLEDLHEILGYARSCYYYSDTPGTNEFNCTYGSTDTIFQNAKIIVESINHVADINLLDLSNCTRTVGEIIDKDNINKYIWRNEISYYENMKNYSYKFIAGMFSTCRISNGVFDAVFCMPEYTLYSSQVQNKNQYSNKKERQYLINSLKFLKSGGLLMYVIKSYRMTKDMASVIAKYLNNVRIINCGYGNVMIVGNRRKDKEPDQSLYERLRTLYSNDFEYDLIEDIRPEITKTTFNIDAFKGSLYHDSMLRDTIVNGSLLNKYMNSLSATDENEENRRPLLPFNVGQLGLVLTSGCLDGIVEETDPDDPNKKYYHVIKGSVAKKTEQNVSVNNKGVNVTEEVVSNKVNINVIKPNGDILTLA